MGERVRRGSKELAVEGAGTRPGRGLKYRVIWGFLMPNTPYMFKQARGTDQPRLQGLLLGSREAGGGGLGPGLYPATFPRQKKQRDREEG